MTPDEKARLDYEQVIAVFKLLTDVRFKLLAFVPTISGAAVALLTATELGRGEQVVLAGLGFMVTLGVLFYEQRNTQLYNNVIGRAEHLEGVLGLSVAEDDELGGLFASRAQKPRKLFELIPMRHDRGLAFVYASVLGAWAFGIAEAVMRPRSAAAVGLGGLRCRLCRARAARQDVQAPAEGVAAATRGRRAGRDHTRLLRSRAV